MFTSVFVSMTPGRSDTVTAAPPTITSLLMFLSSDWVTRQPVNLASLPSLYMAINVDLHT